MSNISSVKFNIKIESEFKTQLFEASGKIGALVYPTVDKSFNQWYPIKNTSINIQTINLNQGWRDIEQDLFRIIDNIESFYLK